jgi:RNA recognition motif-containing protein
MVGIVRTVTARYGIIYAGEGTSFLFLLGSLLTAVDRGDEVEFWLDDDPRKPGLMAVEVRARNRTVLETPIRLFIGNVDRQVKEAELAALLRSVGPVVSLTRTAGTAFAFVAFERSNDARRLLNGEESLTVGGRPLRFEPQQP